MLTIDQLANKTTNMLVLGFIAFCVAMVLTPVFTHFAYKYHWWKKPRTHDTTGQKLEVIAKLRIKRTIPRMAGLIIVLAITLVTVLWNLNSRQTWLPLAGLLGGALLGLIDDIINIRGLGGKVAGLRAPVKLALITIVAAATALYFYYHLGYHSVHIPFGGTWMVGWGIIPLFMLVVVSTGNAVNITDGVDGLAGGLLATAYGAYGVIAALQSRFGLAAFCFTVVGALLSYLWFNIAPARFVMGDVGSFSLGTALGIVAMLTNTLFILPLIGLVFVVEAGSVVIQIFSKKVFHRKVFIASPIHHHFEATGWEKTKVTMRFWVIGQVCAFLGVILALKGGFM